MDNFLTSRYEQAQTISESHGCLGGEGEKRMLGAAPASKVDDRLEKEVMGILEGRAEQDGEVELDAFLNSNAEAYDWVEQGEGTHT